MKIISGSGTGLAVERVRMARVVRKRVVGKCIAVLWVWGVEGRVGVGNGMMGRKNGSWRVFILCSG